jgi:hypothetical protein
MEIPIIFRAQKPGYYHETLYLLTHPQLSDQNGKGYAVRLTGICMDPDLQVRIHILCTYINSITKRDARIFFLLNNRISNNLGQ